jgi:hypothetical protein
MALKAWLYVALAAALIGGGVFVAHEFYAPRVELQKNVAQQAKAVTVATQAARVVEHNIVASDNAADTAYLKGVQNENRHLQAANARLSARLNGLRNASTADASVSGKPGAVATGHATVYAALPEPQREQLINALIGFGDSEYANTGDADTASRRLSACQQELTARTASGSM